MAVTNMNILLVEDDPFLQEGLKMLLVRERFTVHQARSIQDARTKFAEPIHLLILDIGLPDGNGFDFCRDVRQEKPELPILFLTARDEEYDVVRGFECGADDYIAKPFRSLELIARIRALLRRFSPDDMSGGDDLQLNRSRLQVRVRNEVIQLTPT
jgi:DNA-binding response OmpR family regulator